MIRYKNMEQVRKAFPGVAFPKPVRYEVPAEPLKRSPIRRNRLKGVERAIAIANRKASRRYQRRRIEQELLKMWGALVRLRDGNKCQWCGRPGNQPHHIVARSIANRNGWFDIKNGVTLCLKCHLFRLKSDPDAYVKWRDDWLSDRGIEYLELRKTFSYRLKMTLEDLILLKHIWTERGPNP